jgi:hypothetical protein
MTCNPNAAFVCVPEASVLLVLYVRTLQGSPGSNCSYAAWSAGASHAAPAPYPGGIHLSLVAEES